MMQFACGELVGFVAGFMMSVSGVPHTYGLDWYIVLISLAADAVVLRISVETYRLLKKSEMEALLYVR